MVRIIGDVMLDTFSKLTAAMNVVRDQIERGELTAAALYDLEQALIAVQEEKLAWTA